MDDPPPSILEQPGPWPPHTLTLPVVHKDAVAAETQAPLEPPLPPLPVGFDLSEQLRYNRARST